MFSKTKVFSFPSENHSGGVRPPPPEIQEGGPLLPRFSDPGGPGPPDHPSLSRGFWTPGVPEHLTLKIRVRPKFGFFGRSPCQDWASWRSRTSRKKFRRSRFCRDPLWGTVPRGPPERVRDPPGGSGPGPGGWGGLSALAGIWGLCATPTPC